MVAQDGGKGRSIDRIEETNDVLSGRGGLALFVKYLSGVDVYRPFLRGFSRIRKSRKGVALDNLLKQVFCFFADGSSRHLTYFDQLKEDEGYAAVIENGKEEMVSSHQVKRFFQAFPMTCGRIFRSILKKLFIWRLRIEQPEIIELTIDGMVMDNNEAKKRHGAQPTYKKVLGFCPLQIIWNGRIVDAIFRGGKKHGNHGRTVANMVYDLVQLIRKQYRHDVTIMLRLDSAFFDIFNFLIFDHLDIGFIATGKMDEEVKRFTRAYATQRPERSWDSYANGHQAWHYFEWGYRCASWKRFYRAIYTRPIYDSRDGQQRLLDFARPDNVIITNIGINENVLRYCSEAERQRWLTVPAIIASHHLRGADELPHRGLKDFGFEQLPFKRFAANTACYYLMVIAFFLFVCFQKDVLADVIPTTSYPSTVRRIAIDFAAKVVRTSRYVILKVPAAILKLLKLPLLWEKCLNPPPLVC